MIIKYLVFSALFLGLAPSVFAQNAPVSAPQSLQGWTPFREPAPVPEQGVAALTNDPAYPVYKDIYAAIQVNFGSANGMAQVGQSIARMQKDYPNSPYSLFALAEFKFEEIERNGGDDTEVLAIIDRALRSNGANLPDGYILRAKISAQHGRAESALADARVAVRFAPNKPEAQFALARAQQEGKNYPAAEEAYRKFLTLETDTRRQSNIYSWMARMFTGRELPRAQRESLRPKAKEAFHQALVLNPSYKRYFAYSQFLLTETGEVDEAGKYLERMGKDYAGDGGVRYLSALLEYLKWAKAGPNGGTLAALDAVQMQTEFPKEEAFVVSAGSDGLAPVAFAMLRAKAIKNVNVVSESSPLDVSGNGTALFNATFNDNLPLAKELADRGANVNVQAYERWTPLLQAVAYRDVKLATYLLEKGARVNIVNANGTSPLKLAVLPGANSRQLVSLLLKYKADPMTIDNQGQSVALTAAEGGNIDALEVLFNEGKVSVETKDQYGTLLAHSYQDPVMVRYLLGKGANPWAELGGSDLIDSVQNTVSLNDVEGNKKRMAEIEALLKDARNKRPKK